MLGHLEGCCVPECRWKTGQTLPAYGGGWGPVERAIRAGLIICDWAHLRRARLVRSISGLRAFYGLPDVEAGCWVPEAHP
jgi:hypothetical protein